MKQIFLFFFNYNKMKEIKLTYIFNYKEEKKTFG
jgi:hypothetical protein